MDGAAGVLRLGMGLKLEGGLGMGDYSAGEPVTAAMVVGTAY